METMWNFWTEGRGKGRKVRKARRGSGVRARDTVGGVGLSDWIPGKFGMGQKEYQYRVRHAERLWNWYGAKHGYAGRVKGFPAGPEEGGKYSHRIYAHGNLHHNTKDRRVCDHPGRKCPRCSHAASCSSECGWLTNSKKFRW